MIKATFFDLDLTLVDAEHAHGYATERAFAHFGYNYRDIKKMTQNHRSIGRRVEDNLRIRRDGAGITEKELPLAILIKERQRLFLELVKNEIIMRPGAEHALQTARNNNCKVAVVSSGEYEYVHLALNTFHLDQFVDFVVCGNDVSKGKPDPECYVTALKKARELNSTITPYECLVFEDTEAGVTSGKRAGMKVVYIPTPKSVSPLRDYPADHTLKSLDELDDSLFS